jgi:arginyl-tRNA synthetase
MDNPFAAEIAHQLAVLTSQDEATVESLLTTPPDETMGDYAFPCFALARAQKKNPAEAARALAAKVQSSRLIAGASAHGPYVNFSVRREAFIAWVLSEAHRRKAEFGHSGLGKGQTVVVEFSSPNIAKHLGIHHVRTTMIGNALDRIYRALGYRVVGINFLGDWGTQFGLLISAYKRWGVPETLQGDAVANLNALYVRFNEEAKKDPSLRDEGRAWFKRLEDGEPEAVAFWERFRQVSLAAFEEVYRVLDVRFDEISGESKYDKLMPDTIRRLEQLGLAKLDQGALIVDLSAHKMPPVLLRKSDGATLYDTRDIAAAEDRWNRYHFARMIYVVGGDQKLHFRQIFKVLEMMGYPWAKDCVHADFGMVRMKSAEGAGKMSTRRGEIIMLKDVLREAIERARQAIEAKNPDLADKERVAAAIGIGAVVFNDLKRQRIKDVDFDWDAILSFEGETGPYVQYAHARLCSILRKYGQAPAEGVNFSLLAEPEEFALAKGMAGLGPTVRRAAESCEPAMVSQYLLDLCARFSSYYHRHKVVGDDPGLTAARVLLVDGIRQTIANGLKLLGIAALEEM